MIPEETKPLVDEFKKFHRWLMRNTPEGYRPYYFPLSKGDKKPLHGDKWLRYDKGLTKEQCEIYLSLGYNIGLSARSYDSLQIIDIDDMNANVALKSSLIVKTRNGGLHGFYFVKEDEVLPANIPTKIGECRGVDQYVVVAGSYVSPAHYKVKEERPPTTITFNELPKQFREEYDNRKIEHVYDITTPKVTVVPKGEHSALFDLTVTSIIPYREGRFPHPIHGSTNNGNVGYKGDLLHCFRHNVSLNAIQLLCVMSGYLSCEQAGSMHKSSSPSAVAGNDEAIFEAWKYAKQHGYISEDDPIPTRAMAYIAVKNGLIDKAEYPLPRVVYNATLRILERRVA